MVLVDCASSLTVASYEFRTSTWLSLFKALSLSQESHLSTTTTTTKQVYSYQRLSDDKPLGQVDIPLANLSSDGEEWVKSYSLEPFGTLNAGGRFGRWDKNSLESRTPALVRSILCVPRTSALTSKKVVGIKLMIVH